MFERTQIQSLHLFHYYECSRGPFANLSDLPLLEAEQTLSTIRQAGHTFASRRAPDYLAIRRGLEEQVRRLFEAKGGRPSRARPHYMTVGSCPWLRTWYSTSCEVSIPLCAFAPESISFTYGDTFPAFRAQDGRPYRGQVYTIGGLPELIQHYGLPQEWNANGDCGPDRYIEAQIWDDEPLQRYCLASVSQSTNKL